MALKIKGIEEERTKEELYNLALDLIQGIEQKDGKECKELAWMFFLRQHNSTSVFKEVNPEEYNKNIESRKNGVKKKLNNNTITKCYGVWTRTNFFNVSEHARTRKRISEKPIRLDRTYNFNLEPFYYYCEYRIGITFTDEEKGVLELLFLPEPVRQSLYEEYKDIDFLEAMLKYYAHFYLYYLENPIKKKLNHYFGKDFLDYIIFENYMPPQVPSSEPINLYDEKGRRLLKFVKPTKENKKSTNLWDKYSIKFRQYWSPIEGPIITHIGKKNRKKIIQLGEWEPQKNYYSVYESMHIFYPEILKTLDSKIRNVLLNGFRKKNK